MDSVIGFYETDNGFSSSYLFINIWPISTNVYCKCDNYSFEKIQSYTCISDQNASIMKDYIEDVKRRNVEDVGMYANTLYS